MERFVAAFAVDRYFGRLTGLERTDSRVEVVEVLDLVTTELGDYIACRETAFFCAAVLFNDSTLNTYAPSGML